MTLKTVFVYWIVALCLLLAAAPTWAGTTLLVVGDSLSAAYGMQRSDGWVALLEQRLAQRLDGKYTVVNASISGETTAGGLRRLPDLLDRHDPDIVILELGANDGLNALSPAQMQANLAAMIEQSQNAGARILLLGVRLPSNYGLAYTQRFHNVYDALAQEYDIAHLPFFLAPIAQNRSLFQADGLHPTAAAQPVLLDHVWSALVALLEVEQL